MQQSRKTRPINDIGPIKGTAPAQVPEEVSSATGGLSHFLNIHYTPAVLPWFIYPTIDVVNALMGALLLGALLTVCSSTYEREKDNFGITVFERLELKSGRLQERPITAATFLYMVVTVVALVWYMFRRSTSGFWSSYFCCYYEVLCAVALLPQLWMLHQDKRVSPLLANFVVLSAMTRACTFTFWVAYPHIYIFRSPHNRGIQMAVEALNILILSDFLFYWVRSLVRGDREIIIGDSSLV